MLINISSGFFHSRRKFSGIILKCGKDIHCPKISDEFNSASLDMHIMDHLMRWSILAFLDSFFKLKSPNLVQM